MKQTDETPTPSSADLNSVKARRDQFFSRPNLHTAGWALLLALAGYFFGLVDPLDRKPQEVVVKNFDAIPRESRSSSTVVAFDPDARQEMERLRSALRDTRDALNKVAASSEGAKRTRGDANAVIPIPQLEELREAKKAIQDTLSATADAERVDVPRTRAATSTPISLLVPDAVEPLEMPAENRGYALHPPSNLSGIRCPKFTPASGRLRFDFSVASSRLKTMSPLRITVASVEAPLQQTHLFGEDFLARPGSNEGELEFGPDKGTYDVTIGYFDSRKLSGEFPAFYGLSCKVVV
jgi:hypothetical protein